jgi:hypothetical protein
MTFAIITKNGKGLTEPLSSHEARKRAMRMIIEEWVVVMHSHAFALLEIALQEADPAAFRVEDRGRYWFVFLNDS